MLLRHLFFLYAFFMLVSAAAEAQAPKVPIEHFSALPNLSEATLSPDASMVAYLTSDNGVLNIQVQNLRDNTAIFIPPLNTSKIGWFNWLNPDVLLISLYSETKRWSNSNLTTESRLITYNLKTGKTVWLGQPGKFDAPSQLESLIHTLPQDTDHILIKLDLKLLGQPAVYKVNIYSGKRELVIGNRTGIQHWVTDLEGNVRLGYGVKKEKYYARLKTADGNWTNLKKSDWYKRYNVASFTDDPNMIYVTGLTQHGTVGLFKLSLTSGEVTQTIFEHPDRDLEDILTNPATGKTAGYSYFENGFLKSVYFDPEMDAFQKMLDSMVPDGSNKILGKAQHTDQYLIFSGNDRVPGKYFIYNKATNQFQLLGAKHENIKSNQMAHERLINIIARDGTEIPSVLTVPVGFNGTKPRPAVILVHGGPRSRDTAHWDAWVQFLANRGYIVLQPNFRGSTGFGKIYEHAGFKQWGGLMQDDVTDATKWLKDQNLTNNVCIMGASYGGYAALMGTIKEQSLYRCSISINGVTDLVSLIKTDRFSAIGGKIWTQTMGLEGVKNSQISPYHRAKDIKVPTLIIASKDDARISYKMSRDMHKKLKKLGIKTKYVQIRDGGHDLNTEKARHTVLQAVENFLGKHLPVSD